MDVSRWLKHMRHVRSMRGPAVVAAIVALTSGCDLGGSIDCSDFRVDRAAWAEAVPGQEGNPRDGIADGLVKCRVLQGASQAEVFRLLGRPERVSRRPEDWIYTLGPKRRMIV